MAYSLGHTQDGNTIIIYTAYLHGINVIVALVLYLW